MKQYKKFFIVCVICLCGIITSAGISGTYAKYTDSREIDLKLSLLPRDGAVIFLPYDGTDLVTCTLPDSGYYLVQLYDKGGESTCTSGYIYKEKHTSVEVYYADSGKAQIKEELRTDREEDWKSFLFPYQDAPESGTVPGYCIITFLGNEMPEAVVEAENKAAEMQDEQLEMESDRPDNPEETEVESGESETEIETDQAAEPETEEEEIPETMQ